MSYDIRLKDSVTEETLQLDEPHQMKGGTYCVNGEPEAHLNITYNYGEILRRVFGDGEVELSDWGKLFGGGKTGIRRLYGMSGSDSIPILENAISQLSDDINDNYWAATEGNVKSALNYTLALAKMCPDGIWDGD